MQHTVVITAKYILVRANIPLPLWSKIVDIVYVLFHSPNVCPSCCLHSGCRSRDSERSLRCVYYLF